MSNFVKYIGIKEVDLFCFDLPSDISGRIDYKNRKIMINESTSFYALMTLSHEVGHWLSHIFFYYRPSNRRQRESWAESFGWLILFLFTLKCEKKISYDTWKKYHER
jgi:hypothetical protein